MTYGATGGIRWNLSPGKNMGVELDAQFWVNIVAAVVMGVGGWFGRSLWDAVDKLKTDLHQLEVCLLYTSDAADD